MDKPITYVFTLDTNGTEQDDEVLIDQLSQMVREGANVSGPLQVMAIEGDASEGGLAAGVAGVLLMAGEVSLFIDEKDVQALADAIEAAKNKLTKSKSETQPRLC
jgi:hypothetical protein